MKYLYGLLFTLIICAELRAQVVFNVVSGTDLSIGSGTIFSAGGLSMTPSSSFRFNGTQLNRNATAVHPLAITYVSRVYQFSTNTNPFTGTFQFFYNDAELNGLPEASLVGYIHDGSSWIHISSTTNDAINNYVLTNSITSTSINELTLVSLITLPVTWGKISAVRQHGQVNIQWETSQEHNIAYFGIERSIDGINWTTIATNIHALNKDSKQQYYFSDKNEIFSRLYYRIKQVDINSRSSFSTIATVSASIQSDKLIIYPNPARDIFHINNFSSASIAKISVYNNSGAEIKTWSSQPASYNIQYLLPGIYYLSVYLNDGSMKLVKLNKL